MVQDDYLNPYRDSARTHGSDFPVTLWASPQTQRRRFEVMTEMCRLDGLRVLDAGCSRGDFAAFLLERAVGFEHYVGLDGLAEVIAFAQDRALPRCEFLCGDFLAEPALLHHGLPQVVTFSGSLNTMRWRQVTAALKAAWEATEQILIFNFLSDWASPAAPRQTSPAWRMPTAKLLRWAASQTALVAFRQDYFEYGHDATILMRKSRVFNVGRITAVSAQV